MVFFSGRCVVVGPGVVVSLFLLGRCLISLLLALLHGIRRHGHGLLPHLRGVLGDVLVALGDAGHNLLAGWWLCLGEGELVGVFNFLLKENSPHFLNKQKNRHSHWS